MKKVSLLIIMIALLTFMGCNNDTKYDQVDTSTIQEENTISSTETEEKNTVPEGETTEENITPETETMDDQSQSNSSSDIETYNDETQKEIIFGKLSFETDKYHIVSRLRNDNVETYECELDEGEVDQDTKLTFTIQEIEKQDFSNEDSIISFLSDMYSDYESIQIYNHVVDDSGITSLYIVRENNMTDYIVCYSDVCYLIKSNYKYLRSKLFINSQDANCEVYNEKIECADSFTTLVKQTYYINDNKEKFEIVQGKDGRKYTADFSMDEDYQYNFILKNEEGKTLLSLTADVSEFDIGVIFIDANRDGYADIQFLENLGTMNNSYALYTWNNSSNNFVKVKCDETLSNSIEVHDGYLLNWIREDYESGVIQKLVWKNNTLIKESEEPYEADN